MIDADEFNCDVPRPDGFTYHRTGVTVCDACGLKFPYYDCYCELQHTCLTDAENLENGFYDALERHL